METTLTLDSIDYRGFTIQPTEDAWWKKLGCSYIYGHDEHVHGASSVEDAKRQIDERVFDRIETLNARERFLLNNMDLAIWSEEQKAEWQLKLANVRKELSEILKLIRS